MKRGQVFVRALDYKNQWINCDVLDLDDESFKAFIADILFKAGAVVGIKNEFCEGEEIKLRKRKLH